MHLYVEIHLQWKLSVNFAAEWFVCSVIAEYIFLLQMAIITTNYGIVVNYTGFTLQCWPYPASV